MRRWMVGLGAAAVVAAGVCTLTGCADEPKPGEVAVAEVRYPALDKALTDQKGKVVLVDFWATWCGPCVKKFPHLVEMHKKYAAKGLTVVSVSMDKAGPGDYSKDKVLTFLKDKGAAFPNFVMTNPEGDEKEMTKRFGAIEAIPYMVMFDRTGKKVWDSDARPLKTEELDKFVEEELAKK